MPLIPCPECSQEVSDRAVNCPRCGFPIKDNKPDNKMPPLVVCLDCKSEYDLYAEVCPRCGLFNSQKYKFARLESHSMVWDAEDDDFICVTCPICSKDSKVKKEIARKTAIGYSLKGEGTCVCGFTFDKITQDSISPPSHVTISNQPSRRSTAGLLALLLGGIGIHHFYLDRPVAGILNMLFCWTFIPAILALVTAIQYFSMTDEVFNRTIDKTHQSFKG